MVARTDQAGRRDGTRVHRLSAHRNWIAAALSQDPELLKAVESGDPYLAFAARAGLVPDGATKDTLRTERDICKVAMLGMNYGLGARSLAAGTGLSPIHAAAVCTSSSNGPTTCSGGGRSE